VTIGPRRVLFSSIGPTVGFDYGRHFLIQGHENANDLAYATRINLDVADPKHRRAVRPALPPSETVSCRTDTRMSSRVEAVVSGIQTVSEKP